VGEPLRCTECGYADGTVTPADSIAALRTYGRRYRAPLTRFLPGENGDTLLRTRPEPEVWSALEYASHVRDVFEWYDRWIHQVLTEDHPLLEGMARNQAVEHERFIEHDPVEVADLLATNAERLAVTFENVPDDGWERAGVRRGSDWTVLVFAGRAVHEGNHHLLDIGRVLRTVREQAKARAES
jgi:hypothetical protein